MSFQVQNTQPDSPSLQIMEARAHLLRAPGTTPTRTAPPLNQPPPLPRARTASASTPNKPAATANSRADLQRVLRPRSSTISASQHAHQPDLSPRVSSEAALLLPDEATFWKAITEIRTSSPSPPRQQQHQQPQERKRDGPEAYTVTATTADLISPWPTSLDDIPSRPHTIRRRGAFMGLYPGSGSGPRVSQDAVQQKEQQLQQQELQNETSRLSFPVDSAKADDTWALGSQLNVGPFSFPSFVYPELQQQWQGLATAASPTPPQDHSAMRDRALLESYGWGVGGGEAPHVAGLSQTSLAMMPRSWSGDSGGSRMSDTVMNGRHEASVAALLS